MRGWLLDIILDCIGLAGLIVIAAGLFFVPLLVGGAQ